jgi:ArsR family transcriptional regulator
MMETEAQPGGWAVGPSAAMEMSFALAIAGRSGVLSHLPGDLLALADSAPAGWLAQWPEALTPGSLAVVEEAAAIAGVLTEGDYSRATLAIRDLTAATALDRLVPEAAALGLTSAADLAPPASLPDLAMRVTLAGYAQVGLTPQPDFARRLEQMHALLPRILRDGDLHAHFWHWLDRFYYEVYQPWRARRAEVPAALEAQARAGLGGESGSGVPDLAWLSPQSPLLRYPELHAAITAGRLRVYFWADPFGLPDAWTLRPGLLVCSFAPSGNIYTQLHTAASAVADRAAALGDPTRLVILRLIRHFGMINTEIADYLGLARPTVSVHAKILREAGLIRSHQEGRLVRHEIVPGEIRRVFHDLETFLDLGEEPPAANEEPPAGPV